MTGAVHVEPVNDVIAHEGSADCVCGPTVGLMPHGDGTVRLLVIHHSLNGQATHQPGPGAGRLCRCGHPKALHRHYRPGEDCGTCGCRRYRRPGADWAATAIWFGIAAAVAAFYAAVSVGVLAPLIRAVASR